MTDTAADRTFHDPDPSLDDPVSAAWFTALNKVAFDILDGAENKTEAREALGVADTDIFTITGATNLNNSTHRRGYMLVNNATLTVVAEATTAYNAGQYAVIASSHASGGTLTVVSGVTLNGVDGGSVTIGENEAFSLIKIGTDAWQMPNASAS